MDVVRAVFLFRLTIFPAAFTGDTGREALYCAIKPEKFSNNEDSRETDKIIRKVLVHLALNGIDQY